jgi:hypothetical protein
MPDVMRALLALSLSGALAFCTLASSCVRSVSSRVVLTPTPTRIPLDSIKTRAVAIVDSLARQHGLTSESWPYPCTIGISPGTRLQTYTGGSTTWLSICTSNIEPKRLEVYISDLGLQWSAKGDSLRHELAAAFRTQFDSAEVASCTGGERCPYERPPSRASRVVGAGMLAILVVLVVVEQR